jgi:hypothetical protein
MKKSSSQRGYLSQIARPLLPGEPVLKARHVPARAEGERASVPIVEDTFEFTRHGGTIRPMPPQTQLRSQNQPVVSAPLVKRVEPPSVVRDVQSPLSMEISPQGEMQGETANDAMSFAMEPREEKITEPSPPAEQHRQSPLRDENVAQPAPRAEAHQGSPLVTENASEVIALQTPRSATGAVPSGAAGSPIQTANERERVQANSAFAQNTASSQGQADSAEPMPPANGVAAKRSGQERRVHIGTVEIRAVLPQPPAPPVAFRPMTESVPARARSVAEEPLGRGLAWSYGLIQG